MTTIGIPTLHTRVESWECDFNDHWNAHYYSRAFQMAAEHVAALGGGNPGMGAIALRVIRFHSELHAGAAVELRSARVAGGAHDGAAVHLLGSEGRLSATAFDLPGTGAAQLPAVPADGLSLALPRGDILAKLGAAGGAIGQPGGADLRFPAATDMPPARHAAKGPEAAGQAGQAPLPGAAPVQPENSAPPLPQGGARPDVADHLTPSGPVRPGELDHTGALLYEMVIRRVAHGMYDMLGGAGFTADYTRKTGIGRMAAQSALRPMPAPCPAGTVLRVRSRLAGVGPKVFTTWHCLETMAGQPVALVVHDMLAVDLARRRAVPPPEFLAALA